MKKIIILLLFFLVGVVNAQTPKKYDNTFPSWYTYQEVGDSLASMMWLTNSSIPVTLTPLDTVTVYSMDSLIVLATGLETRLGTNGDAEDVDGTQAGQLYYIGSRLAAIETSLAIIDNTTIIDTLYGVITLTNDSTAYQLSALIADTLACYSVLFTNYTSGAVVHFGTNNSVTIDNGAQPTSYWGDAIRYGDNTTDFWLCSTANTTKVRYTIRIKR